METRYEFSGRRFEPCEQFWQRLMYFDRHNNILQSPTKVRHHVSRKSETEPKVRLHQLIRPKYVGMSVYLMYSYPVDTVRITSQSFILPEINILYRYIRGQIKATHFGGIIKGHCVICLFVRLFEPTARLPLFWSPYIVMIDFLHRKRSCWRFWTKCSYFGSMSSFWSGTVV